MRRREFIRLLGSTLAAQAIPADAQEPVRVRTVGALMGFANDAEAKARIQAFEKGLESVGFTVLQASIAGKYLEMLKEMVPQLARAEIMYNPNSAPDGGKFFSRPFIESATKLKVRPITAEVHDASEIENAITKLGRESESGLILVPDNFMSVHRDLIIS